MSKFHNRKTTVDNIVFDSKAEATRYQELRLLEQGGVITALTLQPKFLLQEGFSYGGKKERAITYIADFQYLNIESGAYVVEDVKGTRTEVYKLKRKLFLAKYGGMYEFDEVAA